MSPRGLRPMEQVGNRVDDVSFVAESTEKNPSSIYNIRWVSHFFLTKI